jgi:predicted ATPase/DNA-binding winged helix-turn-helix (wHTH) protein
VAIGSRHAVFLSHASEDSGAARQICEALQAAGVEVWFDKSGLRGGDAWDHKIRREIRDCALFIPIISSNTQERLEGYFRREWRLAVARTLDMADDRPFLVPVVIDGTKDLDARVPEQFRAVQWTLLTVGETPQSFVEHILQLLSQAGRKAQTPIAPALAPISAAKSMNPEKSPAASFEQLNVGAFELYPSERRLCASGKPLELGARAFDLLLVLVEYHGRLVTKATLLERVWPRLVVDENNLPAQVASLRRVLGAGAIRTVPGFGYCLDLPVSKRAEAETAPESSSSRETPPQLSVPRHAWPNRLAPLVGRDDDLRNLQEALDRACLVTIVGAAGVGKTRLAQEILVRQADKAGSAVAWVSLQPLKEAQHVPSAIALALGLSLPEGVDAYAALRQALDQTPLLLIFDSAEHFADELATQLDDLVLHTQGLRALVTSQVPLGIAGETIYRLSALAVANADAPQSDLARCAAVEFFTQRAVAADRRFELSNHNISQVSQICRRLDGNPLALELAAARVPSLGIAGLLERLDDRFRLLKLPGHAQDQRHGALHAAFDWSYGLLAPAEQKIFNRLGAFSGSFSLHAAARMVADESVDAAEAIDLIGRLIDRSLVTVLPVDPPRYALQETARFYALGRLAAVGELRAVQQRMADTTLEILDVSYQEYWSLDEAIWLHRYEPELDNVRAAIKWAIDNDRALGVALYGSAWPLFVETDLYSEGRTRYEVMVALLSDALPRARVARFWEAIAAFDSTRQCNRARHAAEVAADMHAATGDVRSRYHALTLLALNWRGDDAAARSAFEAASRIEDPTWPPRLLTLGALTEGALLMSRGEFAEARVAYRRAVKLALATSERLALAATVNIVELDIACGDTAAALQLGRALALGLRHSGRRETWLELLMALFSALLISGDISEARAAGAELYDLARRIDVSKLYSVLDAMAYLACLVERYDDAARIIAFADIAHEAHGQARRRPTEEWMRTDVIRILNERLGSAWRTCTADARQPLDEAGACSLALGLGA